VFPPKELVIRCSPETSWYNLEHPEVCPPKKDPPRTARRIPLHEHRGYPVPTMDTMDTPPAASTSLSHDSSVDTSVDSTCASNPLKRPRDDEAASGGCSSPSSNLASEDVPHLDLDTETNNRRSFLFKLEELNLVSTDPKVPSPPHPKCSHFQRRPFTSIRPCPSPPPPARPAPPSCAVPRLRVCNSRL